MAAHNETLTEAGGKVHQRGVMPDALSKSLWRCAPCWHVIGIAREAAGEKEKALAEHMARRREMEHQSLAVFMVSMSGSAPEFLQSVYQDLDYIQSCN